MFLYLDSWYIYYYVSLWNSNCSKKRKSSNSKFHFQRKKKKKKNNFQNKLSRIIHLKTYSRALRDSREISSRSEKRAAPPLPPFFFPHHFPRVKQIRKRREKKNEARPMFPVMPPVTSGSVSRYKLYAFYAIMFYNGGERRVEKKERKKETVLPFIFIFRAIKRGGAVPPGKTRFRKRKKAGARKNWCRAPTKGWGMKATFRRNGR